MFFRGPKNGEEKRAYTNEMQKKEMRFVSKVLDSNLHSNSASPKAVVPKFVQHELYQLGRLPDTTQMAPTVKTLNLSKTEVRRGSQNKVGLRMGRNGHQSDDSR